MYSSMSKTKFSFLPEALIIYVLVFIHGISEKREQDYLLKLNAISGLPQFYCDKILHI